LGKPRRKGRPHLRRRGAESGGRHPLLATIVYAIPVQLLAYHVAVAKGTDVDQPCNLAKSVTVE
jgi:glucosamine 6-phosphate synthetase-like amidotransferase/phosphosugar isomerase protein